MVWHDSLPLTRNGKVDRGKLTAIAAGDGPGRAGGSAARRRATASRAWSGRSPACGPRCCGVPPTRIGPDTSFYDLGGDSLAAARIFTEVRKQFGVSITLDRLYEVRTVAAMAAAHRRASAADGAA